MLHGLIDTFLGTGLTGALAWIFQLGTRVSVLEAKDDGLVTLMNSKLDEINRRLSKIEDKLERN